ncbi:hypothetical protein HDU83_008582, partial [Entophlyctis luteolus]
TSPKKNAYASKSYKIDLDVPNDHLYGFNFKGALPPFGKLREFLNYRGRGKVTPNEVGYRSGFIEFGTREDGNTFSKFYNPSWGYCRKHTLHMDQRVTAISR